MFTITKNILVVLCLVLLTSCSGEKVEQNNDTVTPENIVSEEMNNSNSKEEIVGIKAEEKIDLEENKIEGKMDKYGISLATCDTDNNKQDCVNNLYLSTAVGFLDLGLCSMIEGNDDLRIMCNLQTIKAKALKDNNEKTCEDIKTINFDSDTTDFTNRVNIFVKECQLQF